MIGMDVGSTTVKAVVVDPPTKQILWSDYQRHQTKQAEFVLDFLQAIAREFPALSQQQIRMFITGSGVRLSRRTSAPSSCGRSTPSPWRWRRCTRTLSVCELAGGTPRSSSSRRTKRPATRQASTSMNDKCASGTGATIDKCVLKVGLPSSEVVKIAFDDSKLHHVAAKCGVSPRPTSSTWSKRHPGDRDHELARRRHRHAEPVGAHPRQHPQAQGAAARRSQHYLPFLQRLLAQAHPGDLARPRLRLPKDVPIEELILVPENASTTRAIGAVMYGMTSRPRSESTKGAFGARRVYHHRPQVALGDTAGPPLLRSPPKSDDKQVELEAFREQYRIPKFQKNRSSPVRWCAGHRHGRRLDLVQGGAHRLRHRRRS